MFNRHAYQRFFNDSNVTRNQINQTDAGLLWGFIAGLGCNFFIPAAQPLALRMTCLVTAVAYGVAHGYFLGTRLDRFENHIRENQFKNPINIEGLDKEEVLVALYHGAKHPIWRLKMWDPEFQMYPTTAKRFLSQTDSIGNINGRIINTTIRDDKLYPFHYNLNNGPGAAEKALKPLIDKQSITSKPC